MICWVMEMIGKGQGVRGAVWMAVRIPDGHLAAHANQARMTYVDMEMQTPQPLGGAAMSSHLPVSFLLLY